MYSTESRVRDLRFRAQGRWTSILKAIGVDEKILNGRNQPCPMCGGTDRFQYTDKFGEGNYHCRGCGSGGGLKLAQRALGIQFRDLLDQIEIQVGRAPAVRPVMQEAPTSGRMKLLCQRIWNEAKPIEPGDEADTYLRGRGLELESYPRSLRCHPALGYYERRGDEARSKKVAEYPALLACLQDLDGHAVTLHRTYLDRGRKANVESCKKLLSACVSGACVRLDRVTHELAIAEGIETSLAVRASTGKPVWAALSCGNLERIEVPRSVQRVYIYADNDADSEFAGQLSAFTLARRLVQEAKKLDVQRRVQVFVPKHAGSDWADIWLAKLAKEAKTS